MGMHGSNGVGCGQSLTSAARAAAAQTACHVPALAQPAPAASRPALPSSTAPGHDCARAPVIGGGAPAIARPGPRTAPVVDPALVALARLLGSSAPPPRGASPLQQLAGQLSSIFAALGRGISALQPAAPEAAAPLAQAPAVEPAHQPPPPPIGPILSLDPARGVIVDPTDQHGPGGIGAPDSGGHEQPLPSSWVPVPSGVLARVRRRLGGLADRVDALLAEVGMTRLQLLLLTILGPMAVAFVIDVVVQLVGGR